MTLPELQATAAHNAGDEQTNVLSGFDPTKLWQAFSQTPGVGVSITDAEGNLIFVNSTALVLFSETDQLDYTGKRISDYHPPEFVEERLAMIRRVLDENRPLSIEHIYLGKRIESTVWPLPDKRPPCDRVLVISRAYSENSPAGGLKAPEVLHSEYIDLGPLNVLSKREIEVLVLMGHGMSVPSAAKMLYRSPKTIERHKASISHKLQLKGQADMVAIVTAMGLQLDDAELKRLPT
jgi:DNA-binding CsgD family transcriptional regulator